jgi:hypothetical protein
MNLRMATGECKGWLSHLPRGSQSFADRKPTLLSPVAHGLVRCVARAESALIACKVHRPSNFLSPTGIGCTRDQAGTPQFGSTQIAIGQLGTNRISWHLMVPTKQ